VAIPLDPHLSPAKNAERYFTRARKVRETIDEQRERRGSLTAHHVELERVLLEFDEAENAESLASLIARHSRILASAGYRNAATTRTAPPPPFRVFTVSGGFQVWAGKSSENNDLLTTRHTGKDDLWFHARGVGGSHVVLKVHTGKGETSKAAVQEAASIAAYYSKMKKASLVPVTMCLGKYVRKPKGAPPGTVTVEREETVFAEPRLPSDAHPERER
jgi:predicted ribosome quality control (RQC) complex YloA/Tae2 family protein